MKKTAEIIWILILMLIFVEVCAQPAKAQDSLNVVISADGSVSPSTAPIHQIGDTYILVSNVSGGISVQKSNIVVDGNGYTVQYSGKELGFYLFSGVVIGIHLSQVHDVTVTNVTIENFSQAGIYLDSSSGNNICGNKIISNWEGINLDVSSSSNNIYSNNITGNRDAGVVCNVGSNSNNIYNNSIASNDYGVFLLQAKTNKIYGNNITANNGAGVYVASDSSQNQVYLNNFVYNIPSVVIEDRFNTWDNGALGNYWSDYNGTDTNHDGIGDTPYIVDVLDSDNFPLMETVEDFYALPFAVPRILLLSPGAQEYNTSRVDLIFSVDKYVVWIGYSLDGQGNLTVTGNCTIANMTNGVHTLTVYANDTFGNIGKSESVTFTVETPETFPTTLIAAAASVAVAAVSAAVAAVVYLKKRKPPNASVVKNP
jgi:parallel beta-helix repeat protein